MSGDAHEADTEAGAAASATAPQGAAATAPAAPPPPPPPPTTTTEAGAAATAAAETSPLPPPPPPTTVAALPDAVLLAVLVLVADADLASIGGLGAVSRRWRALQPALYARYTALELGPPARAAPGFARRDAAMMLALGCCARLERLNLDYRTGLEPVDLARFARGAAASGTPRLRALSLAGCGLAVERGHFVTDLRHLEELNVAFCRQFDPPAGWLVAADGAAARLRVLDVRMCDDMAVDELAAAAAKETCAFERLNLGFLPALDDDTLLAVAASPRLAALALAAQTDNLWLHGAWSARALAELKRRWPEVEVELRYS
jgi:hypothetical protein